MQELATALTDIVGADAVSAGSAVGEDYGHDEALTLAPAPPDYVVRPTSTEQIARILRLASEHAVPVTPRGSGTGLSGGCVAVRGGILLSFERMNRILELDADNHVAVVQPGVTLAQLDEAAQPHGLVYPILPGESSASLGGNVATNAGGMRAVKYGVTRHNVLGLEVVLASGEVMRTGGKFVKSSSGYDLTQLVIGSEGTLAVVSEATLRLRPRLAHRAYVLLPFRTMEEVTSAISPLLSLGVDPLMLEYIDMLTMAAVTKNANIELGIPEEVQQSALAYLVVVLEGRSGERVQQDLELLGERAVELGALDVYALPLQAGSDLLAAREQAFWVAKHNGANDIVDVVVPRAAVPAFMHAVSRIAAEHQSFIAGCGHAGDGNVHLSVFQPDLAKKHRVMRAIFDKGQELGGVISAEHGIGCEKMAYFVELEDPARLALMRRIKAAFDPKGILNPGKVLG